jgi:hypothetical protein
MMSAVREGCTALQTGTDANTGHVADGARLRRPGGQCTGQECRLLLQHFIAREIGAGYVALGHHEGGGRKLCRRQSCGVVVLASMGDHERRVVHREITERGGQQVPLRPYLVLPNNVDAELIPGCDEPAITGFHEPGIVDPARKQGGDLRSPLRASRSMSGRAGKTRGESQESAAAGMLQHGPQSVDGVKKAIPVPRIAGVASSARRRFPLGRKFVVPPGSRRIQHIDRRRFF